MCFEIKSCDIDYTEPIFSKRFVKNVRICFKLNFNEYNEKYKYISQYDLEKLCDIVYCIFNNCSLKVYFIESEKSNTYKLNISFLNFKIINIGEMINTMIKDFNVLIPEIIIEPPKKIKK